MCALKTSPRPSFKHLLFLFAGIVLIVFLVYKTLSERKRQYVIDDEIAKQQKYYDQIVHDNNVLKDSIAYQQNAIAKELLAKKHGYIKPNEQVIIVKDLPQNGTLEDREDVTLPPPHKAWYNIFFLHH